MSKNVRETNLFDAVQANVAFLAIHTAQNLPSIPPEYNSNEETW